MLLLVSISIGSAAPPAVVKVEPPDWPSEPQATTLSLLLAGRNLGGAQVEAPFPMGRLKVNAAATAAPSLLLTFSE